MDKKALILLIFILFIAAFFRLWQLDKIPPGLYPDEAIHGNEAISNPGKVFYPENNGREGLFINLISLSFSIFGISIWSIRIVSAIIGILTVLGLYLLTKELLNYYENSSRSIALLASFFLAVSFWHVNFSRLGFRAILLPFILVFSFYFLFRGFRRKRISDFITSGIFFGLGFYTYISFRFAILILPAILIPFWFIYKRKGVQKKFILYTLYFILVTFIVALPIGIYFFKNPRDFIGRATPISIFAADNPIKAFFVSLLSHFSMFNFYGDPNWRHNFAGSPQLFWLLGILFLIGIILSIKELISSLKNKNYSLFIIHYSLLYWFFIMLLPGILTFEGIPHSLRVVGTIPVVHIFMGLGGWKIYQFFKQNSKRKKLLLLTVIFFLIAVGFSEFDKYFFDWGKNPEVKGTFTKRFVNIGYFLNSLPEDIQKYVIVNESGVPVPWPDGIPMPAQTIMFVQETENRKQETTYLLPENLDQIKINNGKTVILPMRYDQNLFNEFSQRFPEGETKEKEGFFVYKINF
ncbi:glycosyltransferase family 39 protein [Patescibacteria group bacterium]|nr:glycosyltransferase family 39 protein [Patescibacteria group bacterium]